MEIILLIMVVIIAIGLFAKPVPRPQIMYVPVEIATAQGGEVGCLPVIIIGLVILLAITALR